MPGMDIYILSSYSLMAVFPLRVYKRFLDKMFCERSFQPKIWSQKQKVMLNIEISPSAMIVSFLDKKIGAFVALESQ